MLIHESECCKKEEDAVLTAYSYRARAVPSPVLALVPSLLPTVVAVAAAAVGRESAFQYHPWSERELG